MGRERQRLGLGELAGPHRLHGLDRGDDVLHREHLVLLGTHPQLGERTLGFDAAEQHEVHGAPTHGHQHERARVDRRRDGQHLVRDREAIVRVLRREHRVVQQRQSFGQRQGVSGLARFVDDRLQLGELAGAVVRGLGREPRPQPSLQVRTFVLEPGQRIAHQREELRALVGDAQLVQPQATGADRRFGAHDREAGFLGDLGRAEELLARRAESPDVERRLGEREQVTRPRLSPSPSPAIPPYLEYG